VLFFNNKNLEIGSVSVTGQNNSHSFGVLVRTSLSHWSREEFQLNAEGRELKENSRMASIKRNLDLWQTIEIIRVTAIEYSRKNKCI